MKKSFKITLIFTVIALIAGYLSAKHQVSTMQADYLNDILETYGSETTFIIISSIQTAIFAGISAAIGQVLIKSTGFKLFPKIKLYPTALAIGFGLLSALFIVFGDVLIFAPILEIVIEEYSFDINYLIVGVIYGGIIEELLIRLFLLTLIVYLINKLSKKQNQFIVWIAIILSSVLFGIAHLPALALTTDLNSILVLRTILLNAVPGIMFGYLYTKKGLSYSIIAHMSTHIFMQLVIMPLL